MPRPRIIALLLALSLSLAGCAGSTLRRAPPPPDAAAPWPALLPLDRVLGEDAPDFGTAAAQGRSIESRAAALRRKAVLLRRPALSPAERRRLQKAAAGRSP